MSPPLATCNVNIIPTYLSTDLVTPGRRQRETLPAIGVHQKSLCEPKLWGQETKSLPGGELAYHRFKPSHLVKSNVVVTHRHYGNRIANVEEKTQPYVVTTLLLSKCRLNDQRVPPPFHSPLIQYHYLPEPCPSHLRNSYFSHRCKFQVFPTDGADLRDAGVSSRTSKKKLITVNTTKALNEIRSNLYATTTYQQTFEKSRKAQKLSSAKKRKNVRFQLNTHCQKCKLKIRPEPRKAIQVSACPMSKYVISEKSLALKKVSWPCWPPGEKNITNNSPGFPKIILPKYCLHPAKELSTTECSCQIPLITNQLVPSISQDRESHKPQEAVAVVEAVYKEPESEDQETPAPQNISYPTQIRIERGFKTDAHHTFHKLHNDVIPDLRDADTEGRKHNFHGFNIHLFRG